MGEGETERDTHRERRGEKRGRGRERACMRACFLCGTMRQAKVEICALRMACLQGKSWWSQLFAHMVEAVPGLPYLLGVPWGSGQAHLLLKKHQLAHLQLPAHRVTICRPPFAKSRSPDSPPMTFSVLRQKKEKLE